MYFLNTICNYPPLFKKTADIETPQCPPLCYFMSVLYVSGVESFAVLPTQLCLSKCAQQLQQMAGRPIF